MKFFLSWKLRGSLKYWLPLFFPKGSSSTSLIKYINVNDDLLPLSLFQILHQLHLQPPLDLQLPLPNCCLLIILLHCHLIPWNLKMFVVKVVMR